MLINNERTLFFIFILSEAVSFILEKAASGKMSIYKCEKVLLYDVENSLTFEFPPAMFFSYLFSNLGKIIAKENILNGKKKSHLEMHIFSHFYFCHYRRNGVRLLPYN